MCKDSMIDHLFGGIREADEQTRESFYWFLTMELET